MGMFEMNDEQVVEWRQKFRDLVAPHVHGEEVLSAAGFRRGGAAASMVASKAQLGGLVYALRRPAPLPTVFGYHEIFHLLVVAAVALQYSVVAFWLVKPS